MKKEEATTTVVAIVREMMMMTKMTTKMMSITGRTKMKAETMAVVMLKTSTRLRINSNIVTINQRGDIPNPATLDLDFIQTNF